MSKKISINASQNQNLPIYVGVIFGGRSTEHDISLRSTLYVLKNLPQKYNIVPIGISREGEFYSLVGELNAKDFDSFTIEDLLSIVAGKVPKSLPNVKNQKSMFYPTPTKNFLSNDNSDHMFRNLNQAISCAFPVLHGTNGEDGRLQGLFEIAEIPYVGCDSVASVVGMDKDIQKRLARDAGVNIANYTTVEYEEFIEAESDTCAKVESKIGYPCFIKPNSLGSAIGAGKATNRDQLVDKLKDALKHDTKALVEELIQGTEIECAFLGTPNHARITVPGEISTDDFYSYDEKYSADSKAALFVPARLDDYRIAEVKRLAKKIAHALGLRGFSRIDFWNVPHTQRFLFNEVNTIPGLTSISMFPKLWEYEGVNARTWLEELVESALQYQYK